MGVGDFSQCAERLAARIPRSKLSPEVLAWLEERRDRPGAWGVACSGGADSVCVLLLIYAHFPEAHKRIKVLHFNHLLRGPASDEDATFVKRLAKGLDCRFRMGRSQRCVGRDTEALISEAEARSERFDFLDSELGPRSLLFLGHHQDDVAETLLMRLARGSGLGGLAAPRPVHHSACGRATRLRPLLSLSKSTILGALRECGIPWREDVSNATDRYFRNRLRHQVLPAWRAASPTDPIRGAARSRRLIEEDDTALEFWLDSLLPVPRCGQPLDLKLLAGKPRALFRRALQRWLAQQEGSAGMSAAAFEALLEAGVSGHDYKMSYGRQHFLQQISGMLSLKAASAVVEWAPFRLPLEGSAYLPDGSSLCSERMLLNDGIREKIEKGALDPGYQVVIAGETCDSRLHNKAAKGWKIRRWRNGDRYRPLGAPGTAKLQDLFTNRKVASERRRQLPIICLMDGTIVWCPGLPPKETLRIGACTQQAFKLTYRVPHS